MKPRLLVATKAFWPVIGGVERVTWDVAQAASSDFDVTVLAVGLHKADHTERHGSISVVKAGMTAYRFSTPLSLTYASRFRCLVRQADIVHLHSPYPLGELALIATHSRARVVASYHFDVVRQRVAYPIYGPLLHSALARAEHIICSNPNVICTSLILRKHKLRTVIIPYGIDTTEFDVDEPEASAIRDIRANHRRPLALFVGRLVYYKGLEYLLRATREVDADVLIIGSGPLERKLPRLAKELGVDRRVVFIPHLKWGELKLHFHACDFFVLPSVARSEFFGLVLLEAMACGKPLITTELGTGTSWVNRHGETGLVVPPGDAVALAKAMNELACRPDLARELGRAARSRARTTFSRAEFRSKHLDLYRGLLTTPRPPGSSL